MEDSCSLPNCLAAWLHVCNRIFNVVILFTVSQIFSLAKWLNVIVRNTVVDMRDWGTVIVLEWRLLISGL